MSIEHSLKNTGTRAIHTSVYDHNFLVLDKQPTGLASPSPFRSPLQRSASDKGVGGISQEPDCVPARHLTGQDTVSTAIEGFGKSPDDYKIRIENADVKAGMMITGDRPLAKMALWSIRSVLFGGAFHRYFRSSPAASRPGNTIYEYYTLPHGSGNNGTWYQSQYLAY